MTNTESLALNLLQSFNYAILQRIGPKKYTFFGQAPAFYNALFPPCADGPCTTPWETSPMLDFFLEEAEAFFARKELGALASGIWEEDGITQKDTALMALAKNLGETQLIVIRLLQEDYIDRVGILRKAREQLLENRQLSQNLAMFKEKSRIDGLTSIFNRATFMELLHDEIKRSQILEYPLILLILDIDDFKKVNDTYGHLVGDKVLQGMGATLKASLRRNDIVARYGGEEFAVLIPHEAMDRALQIAEKVRKNVAAMVIPDAPPITVSIGCTAYSPGEASESFFKRADEALYLAKTTGKNKVCIGR
ncbi:putative Diguanylate cyclase [uncultured delta proteobacterium]|uniref:Putative Diguanylate cyclase n=1 Tax=uncultured delta proteobacterium TaxID=34034 RepID=A0A212J7L9_9DELT|nr:putative Diguanylate cyclase [uncultured delta proteobacterium]